MRARHRPFAPPAIPPSASHNVAASSHQYDIEGDIVQRRANACATVRLMRKLFVAGAVALGLGLALQIVAEEKVDLSVVGRIRDEAFGANSRVMETAFYLTDVYGPRLTGSPNAKAAGEWTIKKVTEWGLLNAKREPWGPFGRGWYCTRFTAMMKEPEFSPLIGFAR